MLGMFDCERQYMVLHGIIYPTSMQATPPQPFTRPWVEDKHTHKPHEATTAPSGGDRQMAVVTVISGDISLEEM